MRQEQAGRDELAAIRERAAAALRDGREDEWLADLARQTGDWQRDPYLVLQQGMALAQLDRLAEADIAFRAALALPATTAEQAEFARRQLAWLDEEWTTIRSGRAALWRARLGIGAGGLALGLVSGVLWIVSRRARRFQEGHKPVTG
jgi:hypothetical protein